MQKRCAFIFGALALAPALYAETPDKKQSSLEKISERLEVALDNFLSRHSWMRSLEDRYRIEMKQQPLAAMLINGGNDGQFFVLQRDFQPQLFYDQSFDLHYSRTPMGLGFWAGANWQEFRSPEVMPLYGLGYRSGDSYFSLDQKGNFTFMRGNSTKRIVFEAKRDRIGLSFAANF